MGGGISWGIVGFGWVARDYAAPGILAAGGRVAAVSDPSPAARNAAASLGARPCAALPELLAQPGLDAIYVATPNHLHRQSVEAAAAASKPVLCEKPMAATLADAEAMAGAVKRAGVLYGTAFDQRHHPAHEAMRDAIAAGFLGRVTAAAVPAAAVAWLVVAAGRHLGAEPTTSRLDALVLVLLGGGALFAVFFGLARLLHLAEVDSFAQLARRRLSLGSRSAP